MSVSTSEISEQLRSILKDFSNATILERENAEKFANVIRDLFNSKDNVIFNELSEAIGSNTKEAKQTFQPDDYQKLRNFVLSLHSASQPSYRLCLGLDFLEERFLDVLLSNSDPVWVGSTVNPSWIPYGRKDLETMAANKEKRFSDAAVKRAQKLLTEGVGSPVLNQYKPTTKSKTDGDKQPMKKRRKLS